MLLSTNVINQKSTEFNDNLSTHIPFLVLLLKVQGTSCSVRDGTLVALWKVK